jgi:hypothetical protein
MGFLRVANEKSIASPLTHLLPIASGSNLPLVFGVVKLALDRSTRHGV